MRILLTAAVLIAAVATAPSAGTGGRPRRQAPAIPGSFTILVIGK